MKSRITLLILASFLALAAIGCFKHNPSNSAGLPPPPCSGSSGEVCP